MKHVFRIVVTLVVVLATYCFAYWLPFSLIPLNGQPWIAHVGALLCAAGAGGFAWSRTGSAPRTLVSSVLCGALVLGAIGFAAGFFGPMILAPDANQGPLLGFLITGPAGTMIGAVAGFYWSRWRRDVGPHEGGAV